MPPPPVLRPDGLDRDSLLALQRSAGNGAVVSFIGATLHRQAAHAPKETPPLLSEVPKDTTATVEEDDGIVIVFDRALTRAQALQHLWPDGTGDSSALRPDGFWATLVDRTTRFRLELQDDDPRVDAPRLLGSMRPDLRPQCESALRKRRRAVDAARRERRPVGGLLERLAQLSSLAATQRGGSDFHASGAEFDAALDGFRAAFKARIESVAPEKPLPHDVRIIMEALVLWQHDPGDVWGEAPNLWDKITGAPADPTRRDLRMSSPDYATVPKSQSKCTAYVAEVLHKAVGEVFKVREQTELRSDAEYRYGTGHYRHAGTGKYFPYQAKEWADPGRAIPSFPVVTDPKMGDIWAKTSGDSSHVGIYLGKYAGKHLYISARGDDEGVFGVGLQQEEGIQIKCLEGGVFRRYRPSGRANPADGHRER